MRMNRPSRSSQVRKTVWYGILTGKADGHLRRSRIALRLEFAQRLVEFGYSVVRRPGFHRLDLKANAAVMFEYRRSGINPVAKLAFPNALHRRLIVVGQDFHGYS